MSLFTPHYHLLKRSMAARIALYVVLASCIGAAGIYFDIPINPATRDHSIGWYIKAAEKGDIGAQHILGVDYDFGWGGVARDPVIAAYWFKKAAEQGDILSQYNLGVKYAEGDGVPRNYDEAAKWYRKAADQGRPSAQANLGTLYAKGRGVPNDMNEALKWWLKAAAQGEPNAELNLGIAYAQGLGVEKNIDEAISWYKKSAAQGNQNAQFNLALLSQHGHDGQLPDKTQAVELYKPAADQGGADAQYNLAYAYANGQGVIHDDAQAAYWYRKAAEQGFVLAQYTLGIFYLDGRGVPKDDLEAFKWLKKAADQGNPGAQYEAAYLLVMGRGAIRDPVSAAILLEKVVGLGSAGAQELLAAIYLHEGGVKANYQRAMELYRQAVDQGNPEAQSALGAMYMEGKVVKQDFAEAARWINKSAEQGHGPAQMLLGRMYADGHGVPQDKVQAYKWFSLAVAAGKPAGRSRDAISAKMTAAELTEGLRLVGVWKPSAVYDAYKDLAFKTIFNRLVIGSGNIASWREIPDGFEVKLTEAGKSNLRFISIENARKAIDIYIDSTPVSSFIVNDSVTDGLVTFAVDPGKHKFVGELLAKAVNERDASRLSSNELLQKPSSDDEAFSKGLDLAILAAKRGDFRPIIYDYLVSHAVRPHTSATNIFSSALDLDCDIASIRRSGDKSIRLTDQLDSIAPETLKQQSTYNTAIALMPNFPYPHLCRPSGHADTRKSKDEILSRLHMSESDYATKRDEVEKSTIFTSAYFGHLDGIKKNISHINELDEFGLSALKYAVKAHNVKTFKYILDSGADTGNDLPPGSPQSASGKSPSELVLPDARPLMSWLLQQKDSLEFIDLLVRYKPKVDASSTRLALRTKNIGVIKQVLDAGAPPTGAAEIDPSDPTAVETYNLLLSHGLSVKAEETTHGYVTEAMSVGDSLACGAAAAGNVALLKLLLEHGASPDGIPAKRPLHCAAQGGSWTDLILQRSEEMPGKPASIESIRILLDAGADPMLRDFRGKSFVQNIRTDKDREDVLKLLTARKIDISKLQ
jgi:TPR repeat protein